MINKYWEEGLPRLAGRCAIVLLLSASLAGCATAPLESSDEPSQYVASTDEPSTNYGAPTDAQYEADTDAGEDGPTRYVRQGTGIFVNPDAIRQPSVREMEDGATAINFRNAPIADIVQAILGDILNEAYAIDPSVQGNISLQTSAGLPRSSLIPVLEQSLRLHGLALFRVSGIYQIAPVEAVTGDFGLPPISVVPGRDHPGFGISILPLKYVAVAEVDGMVRPFIPASVTMQADTDRNLMLIAGPGVARSNVLDLITTFDVDWMKGMSLGMFPLTVAEASTVADELLSVFSGGGEAKVSGIVRFVPIERLNSILAITPNPEYLEMVEDWLQRLDRGQGEADGRTLSVYRVQNGRATDLAAVLGELFGASRSTEGAARQSAVEPGFTPATISNEPAAINRDISRPERQGSVIQGYAQGENGLRVIADDANNALVILGSDSEHRLIKSALKDLDVPPLQVLIEATIAEVRLNNELRFGLQWFFNSRNSDFTLSNQNTGAVSPVYPGFSYVLDNANGTRLVLDALDDITDVQVMSSPQLMVLNNQSAILQVGDQVPVATRSSQSIDNPDAPIVNTIEFRDTGVILRVTPRVNAGGLVLLDIEQEVSSVVSTSTSGIDSPTIQQRRIASTVAIQSGETVALGGLIQDLEQQLDQGIPYISRIPILGNLFKTSTTIDNRTELLVLITPRVVRDSNEAREVTAELRERLSNLKVMDDQLPQ